MNVCELIKHQKVNLRVRNENKHRDVRYKHRRQIKRNDESASDVGARQTDLELPTICASILASQYIAFSGFSFFCFDSAGFDFLGGFFSVVGRGVGAGSKMIARQMTAQVRQAALVGCALPVRTSASSNRK